MQHEVVRAAQHGEVREPDDFEEAIFLGLPQMN